MNEDLYKLELKRGIQALLPFARTHKMNAVRWMVELKVTKGRMADERIHVFPPYKATFTIEEDPAGCDVALLSVSAPMRPVRTLNAQERDWTADVFREAFPDHRVSRMEGNFLKDTGAFKVYAIPPGAGPEVDEGWADIKRWARRPPA